MLAHAMTLWMLLLGAAPGEVPTKAPAIASERAAVLLTQARLPEPKPLLEAYGKVAAVGAAIEVQEATPEVILVRLAGIGRARIELDKSAFAGADRAFRRGITRLASDETLVAHTAQLAIELMPEAGVERTRALDALVDLATALCQVMEGVGVYFAAGDVLHPANYVLGVARDRLPRAWLWMGFELGGTTSELSFTSMGLAKAGLMELQLTTSRRDVGRAIEVYFELITLALARRIDFPDLYEIQRTLGPPLVVRHAQDAAGARVWRVAFVSPDATK